MHYLLYTIYYILYVIYYILYVIYYILYTIYYILYTIYYILYTVYCILCTIYHTLYYTILYYTIPYYTIPYYTILYYTILYYTQASIPALMLLEPRAGVLLGLGFHLAILLLPVNAAGGFSIACTAYNIQITILQYHTMYFNYTYII